MKIHGTSIAIVWQFNSTLDILKKLLIEMSMTWLILLILQQKSTINSQEKWQQEDKIKIWKKTKMIYKNILLK